MKACVKVLCAFVLATPLGLSAGCGGVRDTLPPRSALELLMISTAADRAVEELPQEAFRGRRVFLEVGNLDCLDKAYVTQKVRDEVLSGQGALATSPEEADIVLEVASGGLSLNRRDYLLGIPEIPLPIPTPYGPVCIPEIRIFKLTHLRGKAKLLFCALNTDTRDEAFDLPMCYGNTKETSWVFLFIGPFRSSDMPKEAR